MAFSLNSASMNGHFKKVPLAHCRIPLPSRKYLILLRHSPWLASPRGANPFNQIRTFLNYRPVVWGVISRTGSARRRDAGAQDLMQHLQHAGIDEPVLDFDQIGLQLGQDG